MKTLKIVSIIVVISTIISCTDHSILIDSKTNIENFPSFLQKFLFDTAFQFKRTIKPYIIKVDYLPIDAAGTIVDTLYTSNDKKDWHPVFWEKEKMKANRVSIDSAFIQFDYPDQLPPVIFEHAFVQKNGRWYYKTLKIKSLNRL